MAIANPDSQMENYMVAESMEVVLHPKSQRMEEHYHFQPGLHQVTIISFD